MLLAGQAPQAFLDWQQHVAKDEKQRIAVTPRIAIAGIAAIGILGAASVPAIRYFLQPRLAIVNAAAFDGLTVLLDGKPVAERLPRAFRENDDGFVVVRVPWGEHELVAQDGSGREIDRQRFVLSADKHKGLLYSPARESNVCFYHERVTYSPRTSLQDYDLVGLDRSKSLHLFEMRIEHWFRPAPESLRSNGQRVTVEHFTVRALPCDMKARR